MAVAWNLPPARGGLKKSFPACATILHAQHRSRDAVICVYDEAGNVIDTHRHKGDFREWWVFTRVRSHFPLRRSSMIPLLSDSPQAKRRIRRKNSIYISLDVR